MKKELTNEEIAKVFAMYWMACKAIIFSKEGTRYEYDNDTSTIEAVRKGAKYQLEQIPLPAISDEDAIEVCKMHYTVYHSFDLSNHLSDIYKQALKEGKKIANKCYTATGFQYLTSKGYAVPLFFAPNHWANGKTAIELGLAIDATTIKQLCNHSNINRSDGLDECLDCGAKNY